MSFAFKCNDQISAKGLPCFGLSAIVNLICAKCSLPPALTSTLKTAGKRHTRRDAMCKACNILNVSYRENTPLMHSARIGNYEMCALLISNKADVNATNDM